MKKCIVFLWIFININAIGQNCDSPDELFRKRHIIDGMTWGHPYTTFDRHNGLSLEQIITNIRNRILLEKDKDPSPIFDTYSTLYKNATDPMPNDNGMPYDGVSNKAAWAKNNAFVFLIGLDGSGNFIDDTNPADRDRFKQHALDAFDYITGKIDANNPGWGWWVLPVPVISYFVANAVEEEKYLNTIQNHSRSLMLWLQAYDLLKASAEVSELRNVTPMRSYYTNKDSDRNIGGCSPRNKLRQLTRDLYYYSEGKTGVINHAFGWKKNHGIAAASALLMAAQVLNDAGVETSYLNIVASIVFPLYGLVYGFYEPIPHPKYSPINWNEVGQKGIYNNLFEGNHMRPSKDVPQVPFNVDADSYSPYGEGPGYTRYGLLDCGIPAMVAQRNLYPTWTDEPFLKKNEIKNIFNWYDRLRMEDNQIPSYQL